MLAFGLGNSRGKLFDMNATTTNNFPLLARKLKAFADDLVPNIAHVIVEDVKETRGAGKDFTGKKSKRYTKNYSERRKQMGLQTAVVDHRVTGDYLESIALWNRNKSYGVVRGGQGGKETGINNRRPDFGVSSRLTKKVNAELLRLWKDMFR